MIQTIYRTDSNSSVRHSYLWPQALLSLPDYGMGEVKKLYYAFRSSIGLLGRWLMLMFVRLIPIPSSG